MSGLDNTRLPCGLPMLWGLDTRLETTMWSINAARVGQYQAWNNHVVYQCCEGWTTPDLKQPCSLPMLFGLDNNRLELTIWSTNAVRAGQHQAWNNHVVYQCCEGWTSGLKQPCGLPMLWGLDNTRPKTTMRSTNAVRVGQYETKNNHVVYQCC